MNKILKAPEKEEILSKLDKLEPNEMLMRSAEHEFLSGVKRALELGANIHFGDDYALRWSSKCGYLNIVKYLVESGADIHARVDGALKWASKEGHLDVVKYLVQQGVDIHAYNDIALQQAFI